MLKQVSKTVGKKTISNSQADQNTALVQKKWKIDFRWHYLKRKQALQLMMIMQTSMA